MLMTLRGNLWAYAIRNSFFIPVNGIIGAFFRKKDEKYLHISTKMCTFADTKN